MCACIYERDRNTYSTRAPRTNTLTHTLEKSNVDGTLSVIYMSVYIHCLCAYHTIHVNTHNKKSAGKRNLSFILKCKHYMYIYMYVYI